MTLNFLSFLLLPLDLYAKHGTVKKVNSSPAKTSRQTILFSSFLDACINDDKVLHIPETFLEGCLTWSEVLSSSGASVWICLWFKAGCKAMPAGLLLAQHPPQHRQQPGPFSAKEKGHKELMLHYPGSGIRHKRWAGAQRSIWGISFGLWAAQPELNLLFTLCQIGNSCGEQTLEPVFPPGPRVWVY